MGVIVIILLVILTIFLLGFFRLSRRVDAQRRRSAAAADVVRALAKVGEAVERQENMEDALRNAAVHTEALARREEGEPQPFAGVDSLRHVLREIRATGTEPDSLKALQEELAAFIAARNAAVDKEGRLFINPLSLFLEGVKTVFATPLRLLGATGAINRLQVAEIEQSKFFDQLAVVGSILGLLASAWSIVSQWVDYYSGIARLLSQ